MISQRLIPLSLRQIAMKHNRQNELRLIAQINPSVKFEETLKTESRKRRIKSFCLGSIPSFLSFKN